LCENLHGPADGPVLNVSAEYGFYSAYELPKYVTLGVVENKALILG
jgi:hypothetical protein